MIKVGEGSGTSHVERVHVEIDFILKKCLHVAIGCSELLDRGIDIDPAKNQDSVLFVSRCEDLGNDSTLVHLLNLFVGQLNLVFEEHFRMSLGAHVRRAKKHRECEDTCLEN